MTTGYNAGLDSSDIKISFATEAVFATIPSVVFAQLRVTAEAFSSDKTRVRPLEINPSGYAAHAITTQQQAKGSINFGLSFLTFDEFIKGALNNTGFSHFLTVNEIAADVSAVASGNKYTSTLTDKFTAMTVGCRVIVSGFANAANNGSFIVTALVVGATPSITVTGSILVNESPTGGVVSFKVDSIVGTAGDITLTTGTNVLSSSTAAKFAGIVAGQWIRLAGFTNPVNNGAFLVATVTDTTHLIIQNSSNTQVFVTETPALAAAHIYGSFIQNSNSVNTFTVEKQLAPALFLQYLGCYVSSMQITMSVGKFVEGVMNFLVKGESSSTTEAGTSTPTAAPTARVMDNIGGFSAFAVNGALPTAVLQSVELTVSKQRSASQYGIGSASAVGMRRGTVQVDGKLSLFFKDFTYYSFYTTEADLRISFQLTDNLGQAYVITLPAVTIMNPAIVAKGIDQDMVADFTLEGNPAAATDPLYPNVSIQIDKLPIS
jgi:hypothetical protein